MQLDCVHRSWTLTSGYSEHCLFCRAIDAWLIIKTAFAIALIIRGRAIRAWCSSANPNVVIGSLYSLIFIANSELDELRGRFSDQVIAALERQVTAVWRAAFDQMVRHFRSSID
jgi:hypothetical protein